MNSNDAHRLLRESTRHLHDETEAAFEVFDLRRKAGYTAFLLAQAGAVIPLEGWMDRHAARVLPDWSDRGRAALLLSDLAALGVAPARAPEPLIDGDPLGVAYVLEGARMGARILVRRVAADADPAVVTATRFLGQPPRPALWQALLARLDESAAVPGGVDALLAGARCAFALFKASAEDGARGVSSTAPDEQAVGVRPGP